MLSFDAAHNIALLYLTICNRPSEVNEEKSVITTPDLYTTQGGRVAFIQTVELDSVSGDKLFHGYLMYSERGQTRKKTLVWRECGTCVNSDDEQDRVVWKV